MFKYLVIGTYIGVTSSFFGLLGYNMAMNLHFGPDSSPRNALIVGSIIGPIITPVVIAAGIYDNINNYYINRRNALNNLKNKSK